MAEKLMGRAVVKADGLVLETEKGASIDIGGVKRTAVNGARGTLGFTEEIMNSSLEASVIVGASTSLAAIGNLSDATITFTCDTGQVYVIHGGWSADPPVLSEGEGKAKVKFEGPPAEEML